MLIIEHSVQTTAPAWAVWQVLTDVSNWPTWDHGTEYSSIDGPFQAGTTGTLKPKGGPELPSILTKVEPMKMFVQETHLTLARVVTRAVMTHYLTENGDITTVTFKEEINGPLALFWALFIGRDIRKKVPIEMLAMVEIAEKLSRNTQTDEKDGTEKNTI